MFRTELRRHESKMRRFGRVTVQPRPKRHRANRPKGKSNSVWMRLPLLRKSRRKEEKTRGKRLQPKLREKQRRKQISIISRLN